MSIWVYVVQLILIFIPFIWITLYIGARVVAGIMNICQKPSCVVAKKEHNGEENVEERVPFKNREYKLEIQISNEHENNSL